MQPVDASNPPAQPLPLDARAAWTTNAVAIPIAQVPELSSQEFRGACVDLCTQGARLSALLAIPSENAKPLQVLAVLSHDARRCLAILRVELAEGEGYPSLSVALPQAQAFERELFESHGIRPLGHPWLKPLRRHADLEALPENVPAHTFFQVEGASIHEVAVGPVHAGIIEPGHFRFQCHGEEVLNLEIQLGYQHRGAEPLLLRSAPARRVVVAESIAGDTVIGHASAYAIAMEGLGGAAPPVYAQAIRAIALELERLSNHVGDLGALCNDVAYLPGASWFGRLRGEFLNLLMELSGNRFGRSLIQPGGVRFGLTNEQRARFLSRLVAARRDLQGTAQQMFGAASVASRFEHTGVVSKDVAESLGLVGVVARASGCDRDVRRDHPVGIHHFVQIPVCLQESGDVMARAQVRWEEVEKSLDFVVAQIESLPAGSGGSHDVRPKPCMLAVGMVEGWRGEIAHVAVTGKDGQLVAYKIVDPSFHNWFGLGLALRGQEISDFPLCNKSFNLSYAGHDL
jgi:Ni,Fe-hydrogenase III large subunit